MEFVIRIFVERSVFVIRKEYFMAKQKKLKKTEATDESQTGRLGQFGSAIAQIAEEKGIDKQKVIEAIESALAAAYKKDYGRRGQHIRAQFDEVTGGADFFLVKEVVDETTRVFETEEPADAEAMAGEEGKIAKEKKFAEKKEELDDSEEKMPRYNSERDLILEEARKNNPKAKVGDIIEEKMESKSDYGRVAAQTAKQVIVQKIREAERDSMYDEYKQKEGEILSGVIQRIEGRNIFLDLGKSTGILFPSEQVEGERYRLGQRLKVYLMKVESDPKDPESFFREPTRRLSKNFLKLKFQKFSRERLKSKRWLAKRDPEQRSPSLQMRTESIRSAPASARKAPRASGDRRTRRRKNRYH